MGEEVFFEIKSKTKSECMNFFKILFDKQEFLPEQFNKFCHDNEYDLNETLKECDFKYRSVQESYKEYIENFNKTGEYLKQSTIYMDKYAMDVEAFFNPNRILYNQFLEKVEDSLSNARMFLSMTVNILPTTYDEPYITTFDKRCANFANTCMSIYSCYDYILVLIYFYYNYQKLINEEETFEEMLEKVRKKGIHELLNMEPTDNIKTKLKIIIDELETNTTKIRFWSNAIKHRCGLEYYALKPKHPFRIMIQIGDKNVETTNIFKLPVVDIDKDVNDLIEAYRCTYKAINEIDELLGETMK